METKEMKEEFEKLKDGSILFKYATEVDFKDGEDVIGVTEHIQHTKIKNKKLAIKYIDGQLEAVVLHISKLDEALSKNDLDLSVFKEIGEYLSNKMNKTPIKKLTKLNELYRKFEEKTKLTKELELYHTQRDKIAKQKKEVDKL